jgi:hypothetical protein
MPTPFSLPGRGPGPWKQEQPIYEDGDEVNNAPVRVARPIATKWWLLFLGGFCVFVVLLFVTGR